MKKLLLLIILTALMLLTGCSSATTKKGESFKGKASWYGKGFQGKLTASGERYDMNKYTAAHKKLAFGTLVRVTNLSNGKSVVVKINDRGPYVRGRVIDLSKKSFSKIASIHSGVIHVKVEVIDTSNTFRYKH